MRAGTVNIGYHCVCRAMDYGVHTWTMVSTMDYGVHTCLLNIRYAHHSPWLMCGQRRLDK